MLSEITRATQNGLVGSIWCMHLLGILLWLKITEIWMSSFFLNSTKTYKVWQGGEGGMTAVQTGLVMQMMLVPEKTEFQRFL